MWYEILAPAMIITAGLALPGFGLWWIHYWTLGNVRL